MTRRKLIKPCIMPAKGHVWAYWVVRHPRVAGFELAYWWTFHTTLQDAFRAARDTYVNR